jgi:hypothetical protein
MHPPWPAFGTDFLADPAGSIYGYQSHTGGVGDDSAAIGQPGSVASARDHAFPHRLPRRVHFENLTAVQKGNQIVAAVQFFNSAPTAKLTS